MTIILPRTNMVIFPVSITGMYTRTIPTVGLHQNCTNSTAIKLLEWAVTLIHIISCVSNNEHSPQTQRDRLKQFVIDRSLKRWKHSIHV